MANVELAAVCCPLVGSRTDCAKFGDLNLNSESSGFPGLPYFHGEIHKDCHDINIYSGYIHYQHSFKYLLNHQS